MWVNSLCVISGVCAQRSRVLVFWVQVHDCTLCMHFYMSVCISGPPAVRHPPEPLHTPRESTQAPGQSKPNSWLQAWPAAAPGNHSSLAQPHLSTSHWTPGANTPLRPATASLEFPSAPSPGKPLSVTEHCTAPSPPGTEPGSGAAEGRENHPDVHSGVGGKQESSWFLRGSGCLFEGE